MQDARSLTMLRAFLIGLLSFALLGATPPPSNQCITRGFIYSNIGTLFTWSGAAQSSWSGSNQEATYNDFTAYVRNNGSCVPSGLSGLYLITYGYATACAVNVSMQTGTIGSGSYEGAYDSVKFVNPTWVCTPHSAGAPGAYTTSANAQAPSASTPMSISLTGLSLASGSSTAWDVDLLDPSGTTRAHFSGTGSTLSQTVTSVAGGNAGTWTWKIYSEGGSPSCDASSGTITPGDYVTWTGTSFTYYQ